MIISSFCNHTKCNDGLEAPTKHFGGIVRNRWTCFGNPGRTLGLPQISPDFPIWTRQRSAFKERSTVSTLIFSHRAVRKLENDGPEGYRHPDCGGTEFTPHATRTKLEVQSIYCTIVGDTWHYQANSRSSCELDDIESPYQPSNIVLF